MSWKWSDLERPRILELYLKCGSLTQSQRDYKRIYNVRKCPSRREILIYAKRFHETAPAQSIAGPGRPRNARTPGNIAKVRDAVMQSPDRSTRKLSQALNIKRTSLRRI